MRVHQSRRLVFPQGGELRISQTPCRFRAVLRAPSFSPDAQINMAIGQMEAVANNPGQLKMAADQMKNMSDSDLRRAVNQSGLAS